MRAPRLYEQFEDLDKQAHAARFGMWVFLGTEVLFFSGLFALYLGYRTEHPAGFDEGIAVNTIAFGSVNTGVLLVSSFTVALAVHAARVGARRLLLVSLGVTIALGFVFLGFKAYEWWHHYHEGLVPGIHFTYDGEDRAGVGLFFWLYFALTGVHAVHLTIGIGVMSVIALLAWRGRFSPAYHNPVEIAGLYWHFVDVVWIFLLPILYLIERHAA